MRSSRHNLLGTALLAGALTCGLSGTVHAQDPGTATSEIIDPFAPHAPAAGAAAVVIMAEILDPFASLPARAAAVRILSEIIDPFATGSAASSALGEILDPWST